MDKKALATQSTLTGIIMTLVIVGVLLGIGFLVLQEFEDSLGTTSTIVLNETKTLDSAGFFLTHNSTNEPCFNTLNIDLITNESSGALISSGNYTFDTTTGKVAGIVGSGWSDSSLVNISYSFNAAPSGKEGACDGIRDTSTALNEIPQWLSIIVIMIIVGIILAIVFKVLPNAGGSGSFTSGGSESSGIVAEI